MAEALKLTALAIDVAGIQDYIYQTNVLREIIGASYLVKACTESWPGEILLGLTLSSPIEQADVQVEKVFAGGGNALFLFRDSQHAKDFVREYSLKLLETAPGLRVVLARKEFDWYAEPLLEAWNKLQAALRLKKSAGAVSAPLLGLGVTAMCQSSRLPASRNVNDPGGVPLMVSSEVYAKRQYVGEANQMLQERFLKTNEFLDAGAAESYEFPTSFDQLGPTFGVSSYIAVVHADGNGMGEMFKDKLKQYNTSEHNRPLVNAWRELSQDVDKAGQKATQQVVSDLVRSFVGSRPPELITPNHKLTLQNVEGSGQNDEDSGRYYLPFRPLLFGGDDLTFVCDGRLGLTLASIYLKNYKIFSSGNACAGISIVRSHYPFARAYALAEELTSNAKRFARSLPTAEESYNSALDWHMAPAGLLEILDDLRESPQYKVPDGQLQMRPVLLNQDYGWRHWPAFRQLVKEFNNQTIYPRSKLKGLEDALRRGPSATDAYRHRLSDKVLPPVLGLGNECATTGWEKEDKDQPRCVYYDALEALDYFMDLELP